MEPIHDLAWIHRGRLYRRIRPGEHADEKRPAYGPDGRHSDGCLALPDVDAVVVSLKIRSVAAAEAVERARAAYDGCRSRGAEHVLYKICSTFDSTDAGNIGPVLDALRADAARNTVLVTPAFPETGRTVYFGHLFVGRNR